MLDVLLVSFSLVSSSELSVGHAGGVTEDVADALSCGDCCGGSGGAVQPFSEVLHAYVVFGFYAGFDFDGDGGESFADHADPGVCLERPEATRDRLIQG